LIVVTAAIAVAIAATAAIAVAIHTIDVAIAAIRSRKQDNFDGAPNIVLPCPGS
jgi:hypothetical protein